MNIKSLLFGLLLLPLSAAAQTTLGYTNQTASRNNVFRYTSSTDQRLAMRLSAEKLQLLKGQTINSIRIAFGSKQSTGSKATIFLTTQLGGTPILTQECTISSTNKLVEIPLATPYVVTGLEEALYVGCQMEIGSQYGAFSADFAQDVEGVFFCYGNGGWNDIYGKGYGCPNIEVVTSQTLDFTDVVLKPFREDGYVKQGQQLAYTLQVQNFGTRQIDSFTADVTVGGEKVKTISLTDLALKPHATMNVKLDGIVAQQNGNQDIRVSLTQVNGAADADASDNQYTTRAYFYPTDMQRSVLLEVFTGQTCTNCPTAHTAIANVLGQLTDVNVVEIAHHSGYVTDIFSMKEDWTLTSLYNNSTYAPAVMYNRTDVVGDGVSPVNQVSADECYKSLTALNNARPYVSINLQSSFDASTRNVTLKCRFFTHEQMPGDDIRYSIWLVQDSLIAKQNGGSTDYVHNAVSRGALTGTWGEGATFTPGQTLEVEKSFTLPEVIASTSYEKGDGKNLIPTDLKHMKLVVFVHQQSASDVAACRVFNCAEVEVGEPAGVEPAAGARLLSRQTFYGDAQGSDKADVATRTLDYCYDAHNRLVRCIETSKDTKLDTWQLTHYYLYDYDAQGNLLRTNSLQYGVFDYDENGYFAANDTITYVYNSLNQLVEEHHPLKYYVYTYDAQGQRVSASTWNINSITRQQSNDVIETYSDFNAQGQPRSLSATSPSGKAWNEYTGVMTYDADGHLIEKKCYTRDVPAVLKNAEYWTYQDGILVEHRVPTVFGDGQEQENTKEVFTPVDGNTNLVEHTVMLHNDDDTWSTMSGSRCIDEYIHLAPAEAPTLTVTPDADALNTVTLSVSDAAADVKFYRSGIMVSPDEASATDVASAAGRNSATDVASAAGRNSATDMASAAGRNAATATDARVKNGEYEYMAVVGGRATNLVRYTHHTDLPVPANVHVVGLGTDSLGTQFAVIGWDAFDVDERMGFIGYHLILENMRTYDVTTSDVTATTLPLYFGTDKSKTFCIQAHYQLGRVNSQPLTVNLNDILSHITDAESTPSARSTSIYDLQGRRLHSVPQHGLYIKAGRKVVK